MSVLVVAAHDGKTVRANVANAVAAGTGRRLRNLPFDPMSAP